MKKSTIIILAVLAILLATFMFFGHEEFSEKNIAFENLAKDGNGSFEEAIQLAIRNDIDFQNFWTLLHASNSPEPEKPIVNFDSEMVIAVVSGTKSSGGHDIEIERIIETEDRVVVTIKETAPEDYPEGAFFTQALTHPYHVVKMKKIDKPTEFTKAE